MDFLVITFFTRRNQIPLIAFPSAAYGHHMIHGQLNSAYLPSAIVTNPRLDFSHPPGCSSHFAGLFLFSLDLNFIDDVMDRLSHGVHTFPAVKMIGGGSSGMPFPQLFLHLD